MSGTFIIAEDSTWMPQNWVFDRLVQRLSSTLEATRPDLSNMLLRAQMSLDAASGLNHEDVAQSSTEMQPPHLGFGYLDITSLGAKDFAVVLEGVTDTINQSFSDRDLIFPEPGAFAGFLSGVSLLKALLRVDRRAAGRYARPCRIIVNQAAVWEAHQWIYDMVLEHIAGDITFTRPELSIELLSTRGEAGMYECNLQDLQTAEFALLVPSVNWMLARYGDAASRDAYSPSAYAVLAPNIVELASLVLKDARAAQS